MSQAIASPYQSREAEGPGIALPAVSASTFVLSGQGPLVTQLSGIGPSCDDGCSLTMVDSHECGFRKCYALIGHRCCPRRCDLKTP